jgi:hypothetical protein
MKTSKITGKQYDESRVVYLSNFQQCFKYFEALQGDKFLDIIWTSEKRPDTLVFVWEKCPETARLKELWDQKLL